MPADDLTLALRIRADVQQALAGMRSMDRSLGNIDKRGKRADRTMRNLARTALRFAAVYLSLRGIASALRAVIGTSDQFERLELRMRVATGSAEAAGREMAFVRAEAERLGLDVLAAAEGFSAFAAAARGTKIEGQGARDVFIAVAEASAAMGLVVGDLHDFFAGVETLADKPGGTKRQIEDLESLLAGDARVRDEIEERRRNLEDAITEGRRLADETEADIARLSGNRARLGADGVIDALDRQLIAQVDQALGLLRGQLRERRALLDPLQQEYNRLAQLLSLAPPGVPRDFTLAGPGRIEAPGPTGPSDEEVKAAKAAADKIEAILAASQDRLAQLTLSRIELIAREEAQAVDELRRLGETKGLDAAEVEAAIAAVQKAAAVERHQIHVEGLAADHEALVASLEAGTQAEREAARARAEAHADTVASIEGREVDLGIVGAYEAAIRAANRWRDETLAGLDAAGEGHEALRARVDAVHLAMIESARAAAREGVAAGETWIDGMKAALQELGEEGASAADQAREATENAFQGMEDALVAFVTTGKLSFSGFVDSIIADLARIAVRRAITEPLADALFNALPGLSGGGPAPAAANGANLFGRLQAGVGHTGAIAGQPGGVSRAVPAAIFAGAPRYHSGGVAGLRPDEVPIIAQRGEAVLPRGATLAMPPLEINFHNEGTAQREVRREVHLDPRAIVVDVFTDDWNRRGPIRRTVDRDPPGGGLP